MLENFARVNRIQSGHVGASPDGISGIDDFHVVGVSLRKAEAQPPLVVDRMCLTVVVYSLNMFGDAVRDLLDPRLRGRLGRYGADAAASPS